MEGRESEGEKEIGTEHNEMEGQEKDDDTGYLSGSPGPPGDVLHIHHLNKNRTLVTSEVLKSPCC